MKVSIIVPVYNVEDYIERCFESVTNQAYENIECIFVDDCSPDNSKDILEELITKYRGGIDFKVLSHKTNRGLSVARNTGIENALGDYIYFLDSDDVIAHDSVNVLIGLAIKYQGVEIVQGNSYRVPKMENDWREIKGKGFPEFTDNHLWIKKHCFMEPRIISNATNKLINTEFIRRNRLYFKEGIIHEDEHWTFFVAKKISSIAFTTHYTYIQHVTEGSIMQSADIHRSVRDWLIIIKDCFENIDVELEEIQIKFLVSMLDANARKLNENIELKENYRNYILDLLSKPRIKRYREVCVFLKTLLLEFFV